MQRLNPTVITSIVGGLVVLLVLGLMFAGSRRENSDKLTDDQVAGRALSDPEKRCGSQATYDLIKRELFRRAAEVRGSDQAVFNRLGAYSVVRMDAPMLKSEDEAIGIIHCTGSIALDLPPGVAVIGGRRTLTANIGYAIQSAADGSGDVLTLSNADQILTPLATLARVGETVGDPLAPASPTDPNVPPLTAEPVPTAEPPPPQPQPQPAVRPPAAAPPPPTTASPSFNCRNARTRGEIAVCRAPGLAALDRQMAAQFNSAMGRADPEERALLQRTRGRFLSYRDGCRTDSCVADSYRGRMREIGDIMSGRWQGQ